jgi:hypothetical protein
MDIYCEKCAEPWDYLGVDEGDMTCTEAGRFHAGEGCPACKFGAEARELSKTEQRKIAAQKMLRDVLGDDTDGLVAEMEDFEFMTGGAFE